MVHALVCVGHAGKQKQKKLLKAQAASSASES
jgi:hypothetical protein